MLNMGKPIFNNIQSLKARLTDENTRISLQFLIIFFLFSFVSMFMTIINIATGYSALMWATIIFSIANMINVILCLIKHKCDIVARYLFSAEIILLFVFFILNGEPEGFAVNWSTILPIGGMILYKRRYGTIMSLIFFVILAFFFYLPVGHNIINYFQIEVFGYDQIVYTESYMLRFPVLYLSCFGIGLFFETIRSYIQEELALSREKYKRLSFVDTMTGLSNENSYQFAVSQIVKDIQHGTAEFAVVVLDVNNLKKTNDTLGHLFGNHLITATADELVEIFAGSKVFHIGGDEFVVLLQNEKSLHWEELYKNVIERLNYSTTFYEGKEMIFSVAAGVKAYEPGMTYDEVFTAADNMMYENKQMIKEKYKISR